MTRTIAALLFLFLVAACAAPQPSPPVPVCPEIADRDKAPIDGGFGGTGHRPAGACAPR